MKPPFCRCTERIRFLLGPVKMSTGLANFISGGLGAFVFWIMAIPADNVKK